MSEQKRLKGDQIYRFHSTIPEKNPFKRKGKNDQKVLKLCQERERTPTESKRRDQKKNGFVSKKRGRREWGMAPYLQLRGGGGGFLQQKKSESGRK